MTTTASSTVRAVDVVDEDGVRIVTVNRPDRRNALNREIRTGLAEVLTDAAADPTARAVVLASREAAFSAGQDLGEAQHFRPEEIGGWIDEHMDLYRALLSFPRPLVAAVDGCCVGAGLQTALLCDLRLATPTSFFAMPELDDAIPCILGVWTLWDVIGRGRTTEMVLTNRQVPAPEALSWGLVTDVVDQDRLLTAAVELADRLARKPALAMRLTKERLKLLALEGADSLTVHAQYAHTVAFATGEPARAMAEFLAHGRSANG